MWEYDYAKLYGKIRERGFTHSIFAHLVGMNPCTLSEKLNNKRNFKQNEITQICKLLDIEEKEIQQYFFNIKHLKSGETA